MKKNILLMLLTFTLLFSHKALLMPNMEIRYQKLPQKVDSISDFFFKGIWYGRLRSNNFIFDQTDKDHQVSGIGASFIYKSAYYYNFGLTIGSYNTFSEFHEDDEDTTLYRAGKGVLSRYDVLTKSDYTMSSLAQAYIEYNPEKNSLKIGRMLFETLLTKSNDTKMIPNTFEGVSFENYSLEDTVLKLGFFKQMKLRDHSTFHHILAYGDDSSDPYSKYSQNDDSAMHRGLTISKLKEKGIEDRLLITEFKTRYFKNMCMMVNYTLVPELIGLGTFQMQYNFFNNGLRITPGIRVLKQFDIGAGEIGGANLKNNIVGYKEPNSLDSAMIASKVDITDGPIKLRFGYSKIQDKGDLVTPWRGFPTGGYTRAMGTYNWYANTQTFMFRADYDFDKAGIFKGIKAFMRYAIQDFDDKKAGVQADSQIVTFDFLKQFNSNIYFKTRFAFNMGDDNIIANDGSLKSDPSYNAFRIEMNYLF